jgi:hypothetical protein
MGFGGGYFYIQQTRYGLDRHRQYRSADGETWTPLPQHLSGLDFSTLTSGGGVTVASEVTRFYSSPNYRSYFIHSSTDGLTWTPRSTLIETDQPAWPVYGLGRYFYGGKSSNDGISWVDTSFTPTHAAGDRLFRIVTLSWSGSPLPDILGYEGLTTTVSVSTDGFTSNQINVGMRTPRSVAFGNGRYVMVGDGGMVSTSADALTWIAERSVTSSDLYAVIFAFNRFVAAGKDGAFIYSSDGLGWSDNVSPGVAGLDFSALAATDELVVATSISAPPTVPGGVSMPPNLPAAFVSGHAFTSVVAVGETFIAVSQNGNNYFRRTQLWKSTDGTTWTEIPLGIGLFNSGRPLLAAGNGSALLAAPVGTESGSSTYTALLQLKAVGSVAPTITHSPVAKTVARGESAFFAVGVTGTGPFSYQWYRGGTALAGATSSTLTLTLTQDSDAGDYTVKVTNAFGSATSTAGKLTTTSPVPLTITEQPVGGTLLNGTTVNLRVGVKGSGPITYQWRRNGTPISSATSPTYDIVGYDIAKDSRTGSYDVVVTAPYSSVTSQVASVIWGGPSVTISPANSTSLLAGSTLRLTATASGNAPFTFRWFKPGGATLNDATSPTLILPFVTPADSSPYWVEVTDASGQSARAVVNISVTPNDATGPTVATATAGEDLTLRADIRDTYNLQFQWRRNSVAIAGATSSSYTIRAFSTIDEGNYDVLVTAPDGTVTTRSSLTLTLEASRLVNLSARGFAGSGEDTLIQGFVLRGATSAESPDVLVRSVGPTLTTFGVTGPLADPAIRVLSSKLALQAENDNWSTLVSVGRGRLATASDFAKYGAFALSPGSRDSAVLIHEMPEGACTALVSSVTGSTGFVMNEVYGPVSGTQRLVNLSARARVSSGDNVLIAGFVITGKAPLRVMIRGVGPALGGQGITRPLMNPRLVLFNAAGREIHNNDNWSDAANATAIRTTAATVGAFPLPEGSHDAVMLETLTPGVYTAHVTAADQTSSGVALVEIYEVR